MTPAQNRKLRELFDAAVGKPADEQAAILWEACGEDEEMVRAVWRLLGANRKSDGFLSTPVWQFSRAQSPVAAPGSTIDRYTILRELGAGGMGIVYQVVRADNLFRRVMALKVVRPGFVNKQFVESFEQERRILGDLDHPNIVRIVDGGSVDGVPYFVMDYVDGTAIDLFCKERQLTLVQRLKLFQHVCAATRYLHDHRVVHGDLKPSNILVTKDATAKILDFGLARVADRTGVPSQDGAAAPFVTRDYASPERIRGDAPSFSSDVFALGVVLYELVAGVKPNDPDSRPTSPSLTATTSFDPPPPSAIARVEGEELTRFRKSLRGDVDSIVLKAMRWDPSARYPTVRDLESDIGNYLAGKPVEARRGGPIYHTLRFLSRYRMAIATMLTFSLLIGFAGWQARELVRLEIRGQTLQREIVSAQSKAVTSLAAAIHSAASMDGPQAGNLFEEEQRQDTRDLFEAYRVKFPETLRLAPGKTAERRLLVEGAREYLLRAEPLFKDNPDALRELAYAWLLLGDIEGNPRGPNLRDQSAAASSYGEASRILEPLSEDAASHRLLDRVRSRNADLTEKAG